MVVMLFYVLWYLARDSETRGILHSTRVWGASWWHQRLLLVLV